MRRHDAITPHSVELETGVRQEFLRVAKVAADEIPTLRWNRDESIGSRDLFENVVFLIIHVQIFFAFVRESPSRFIVQLTVSPR